jgi:energy-coupling factor transporter ATP-binding protein EcfA2
MYAAKDIRVSAGKKVILDGASLSLMPGKVIAIVGPNGAGKSTLMKVLAGERRFDRGTVSLDEVPLTHWDAAALAKKRAVLPQSVVVAFPFLASGSASSLPACLCSYGRTAGAAICCSTNRRQVWICRISLRHFGLHANTRMLAAACLQCSMISIWR